jgi:hypothetical protein
MGAIAPAPGGLVQDLWLFAQSTAGSLGYQFNNECSLRVRDFIQSGVATLARENMEANPEKISAAKTGIGKLVNDMVLDSANFTRLYRADKQKVAESTRILVEDNFTRALAGFCPCYPFC